MGGDEELKELLEHEYYIDVREDNEYGAFVSIYDLEVADHQMFSKVREHMCLMKGSEIKEKLRSAVSIIFYGERAVELGCKLNYVYPSAVKYLRGVKTAICIKV